MKRLAASVGLIGLILMWMSTDALLIYISFHEEILGRTYLTWIGGFHAVTQLFSIVLVCGAAYQDGHTDATRHFTEKRS